jgi:hypothetical protein
MDHFKSWRERYRLAATDDMPALFVDLQHWRQQLQTALAEGHLATRIKKLGRIKDWPMIVAVITMRLRRKEKSMQVLERLLSAVFSEKLDSAFIRNLLSKPDIAQAPLSVKRVITLGLLDHHTQAVAQTRINTWLYEHSHEADVIALDMAHQPLRKEQDPLRHFIRNQANVGIRDVWKLVAVIAPLYQTMYGKEISQEELTAILQDDSFVKILFTFAISASEIVDPLQQRMIVADPEFSQISIFNPRYFTLQTSKNGLKIKFSPLFEARLKELQPDKTKPPIFTGCPLTYLTTKDEHKISFIGALARWCVDLAKVHYVPLFSPQAAQAHKARTR